MHLPLEGHRYVTTVVASIDGRLQDVNVVVALANNIANRFVNLSLVSYFPVWWNRNIVHLAIIDLKFKRSSAFEVCRSNAVLYSDKILEFFVSGASVCGIVPVRSTE